MDIKSSLDNIILLVGTIFYWASIIYTDFKLLSKISFYGTILANSLIFCLLSLRWLNYGYFPLSHLYESLLFLAWGITFTTIVLESKTKTSIIGSISNPISLFIIGFAGLSLSESMQAPSPFVPALKSNWLMLHVTIMMLSYASLIVGSLLGIFFLILTNGKKEEIVLQGNSYGKTFNDNRVLDTAFYKKGSTEDYSKLVIEDVETSTPVKENRLSLLESIDNLSYRTISFGFPMLTIGIIIAGAVWANEAWGSYWSWDPKETWALVTICFLFTRSNNKILAGKKTCNYCIFWVCCSLDL